jgi:rhodanese-related sulfurtransferase
MTDGDPVCGSGDGRAGEPRIRLMADQQSAIDRVLADAGAEVDRVEPWQLAAEIDAGALVVDIRPSHNRAAEGSLPGAVVIERIHLEWRLDPTSAFRLDVASLDRRIIVVCNEGYASILAAQSLRRLGLSRATDLAGGYRAWRALDRHAISDP